jgi:hypothetical protein
VRPNHVSTPDTSYCMLVLSCRSGFSRILLWLPYFHSTAENLKLRASCSIGLKVAEHNQAQQGGSVSASHLLIAVSMHPGISHRGQYLHCLYSCRSCLIYFDGTSKLWCNRFSCSLPLQTEPSRPFRPPVQGQHSVSDAAFVRICSPRTSDTVQCRTKHFAKSPLSIPVSSILNGPDGCTMVSG